MFIAGVLVLLMTAGLGLVSSGLCRAKNAGQVVTMSFMIFPMTVLGFWICGFPLLFGTRPTTLPAQTAFLYDAAAVTVGAAIPAGIMAERWRFSNFMLYACWAGALPFAWFGRWVWGGGWLAQSGQSLDMGHGFVDFAGSSVIHMTGGVIGLVGAVLLGPRLGKYARDGRPRPMPGHNLVYVTVGTLLLALGWFGFNAGPALLNSPDRLGAVVVNTILALAAGAAAAYAIVMVKFRKPDPSMLCNGMLAGLVAISGACAFVNSTAAIIIGAVAGILVIYSVLFFERRKVDDPVGGISVHGVSGAWGVLSLGLFANGSYGLGWNGVHTLTKAGVEVGVCGAFGTLFGGQRNDWSQLGAQIVGALTCVLFIGVLAFVWFKISAFSAPLRSKREEELAGLDLPEMGAECYPDFHLNDTGTSRND
jgi:Amt family ammonium transporter